MSQALQGSYLLEAATIDRVVTERLPGAYVLGHKRTGGIFRVSFVGRAEANLNVRLKQQAEMNAYSAFMFQYCTNPQEAFEAECKVFHTFAPADNKAHPARPLSADWKCPNCKMFG